MNIPKTVLLTSVGSLLFLAIISTNLNPDIVTSANAVPTISKTQNKNISNPSPTPKPKKKILVSQDGKITLITAFAFGQRIQYQADNNFYYFDRKTLHLMFKQNGNDVVIGNSMPFVIESKEAP